MALIYRKFRKKPKYTKNSGINALRFRELLKEKRRGMSKRARIKKAYSRINYIYPFYAETSLFRVMKNVSSKFVDRFDNWFKSHIDTWKQQRSRYDSWDSQVEFFLRELKKEMDLYYEDHTVFSMDFTRHVEEFSVFVFDLAQEELGRHIENILGEIYYGSDIWWEEVKTQWIAECIIKTKDLTNGYIERIREITLKGVQENWSFEKIEELIQTANTSFTSVRTKFLARNLVSNLNGIVEQNLQQSIGINHYVWTTMADERVRGRPGGMYPNAIPSHWVMDGKICDWRNSVIFSKNARDWQQRTTDMPMVHPGMEFNCRCMGRGYFKDLIEEIDLELEGE